MIGQVVVSLASLHNAFLLSNIAKRTLQELPFQNRKSQLAAMTAEQSSGATSVRCTGGNDHISRSALAWIIHGPGKCDDALS